MTGERVRVRDALDRAPVSDWRVRAACRAADPELFDPPARPGPVPPSEWARVDAVIERYCRSCIVSRECLAEARRFGDVGIWGGHLLTEVHGSIGGYNRHRRRGEDACVACREAVAAYSKDRRDLLARGQS